MLCLPGNGDAIGGTESSYADVDYAMLVKMYGAAEGNQYERRHSPGQCTGAVTGTVTGNPNAIRPAMEAGSFDRVWMLEEIAKLADQLTLSDRGGFLTQRKSRLSSCRGFPSASAASSS